jgi:acyl carrier protein
MNTTHARTLKIINAQGHFIDSAVPVNRLVDDFDFDSLDRVEIMIAIEEEFGIEIVEDDFDTLQTVQQVIDHVDSIRSTDAATIKTALISALAFISGFDDDTSQVGIKTLQTNLRKAISHVHVRERYIATLNKAGLDCVMELDWIKNEYPMPEERRESIQMMVNRFHASSEEVTA